MQSRRDQVQAHSFVMGRLTSGLLRVDIDGPEQPVPRTTKGTMGGLVLAAVIGVVIALFGIIVPAGSDTSWAQPGALVIDSGTGARYLFVNGTLRPALNVTSARLVAGDKMSVKVVSSDNLHDVRLGPPFGIVDAPDAVPGSGALATGPWSACAANTRRGVGEVSRTSVLTVGTTVPMAGLTVAQGILVAGPDGTDYLLWDGRRLRMVTGRGVQQALGYGAMTPVPVTAPFLDAVPAGPDLVPPAIDGMGTAGPDLGGPPTRIGQLFADAAGKHYVLTAQGLAALSGTQFALLRGDPRTQQQAYGGAAVTAPMVGPDDLARHTAPPGGPVAVAAAALPPAPPHDVDVRDGQAVCITLRPGTGLVSDGIGVATVDSVTAGAAPPSQGPGIEPSCQQVDLVAVRPGSGALVAAAPAGGGTGSTPYLVGDDGVKFPIASAAVLTQLGYSAGSQITLPATVLGLLPTGPSLDPAELADGGLITPPPRRTNCE
jgi:type VII secretion protein EccB